MSATKLSLPGGYFNAYGGPVDELYYFRASETAYRPYATLAEANGAITASLRSGRTVNVAGKEYWWEPTDTSDAGLALKANLDSVALTGIPTTPTGTPGLSSQQITNAAWVLNEISTAGSISLRVAGDWDASTNLYPSATSGTGPGGAIRQGDQFTISVAGTLGGVLVEATNVVYAKLAAPGQTAINWVVLEHNVLQATETLRGTALLATLSDAGSESSTEDTKIVTLKKLWVVFSQYASQARTIVGKWTFGGGIDLSSQKITNLAPGTTSGDGISFAQLTGRFRGAWAASSYYAQNDTVLEGGLKYYATVNFTSGTSFLLSDWTVDSSGAPDPAGNARKVLKSDGTAGTYQYQLTNDVVGGSGIYATLALATASAESSFRQKGQLVTVTDDPTPANNGTYHVNADLSLSLNLVFTLGQFTAYTAPSSGVQSIPLPAGAVGTFDINVLETSGAERPLSTSEYAVSSGILTVASSALIAAGDVISGYYYGANAAGQAAPSPVGGLFRGAYGAGLVYQASDTVVSPTGQLVAATTLINPSPATFNAASWYDPNANKVDVETYSDLAYFTTLAPNFAQGSSRKLTITGPLTITSISNKLVGRSLRLFITNKSATSSTVTLPTIWNIQGVISSAIGPNKTGVIVAEFLGDTEAEVWAHFATQY